MESVIEVAEQHIYYLVGYNENSKNSSYLTFKQQVWLSPFIVTTGKLVFIEFIKMVVVSNPFNYQKHFIYVE
jgi:hypothetical protein